jgi:hypothetical protein
LAFSLLFPFVVSGQPAQTKAALWDPKSALLDLDITVRQHDGGTIGFLRHSLTREFVWKTTKPADSQ